jgi:hypothetical protein
MNEEKLPAYFHDVYADTLTVFKRMEDAPPEIIYRAEMAAPKPWIGLTDEEINSWDLPVLPTLAVFARFLEAKIKEKNS